MRAAITGLWIALGVLPWPGRAAGSTVAGFEPDAEAAHSDGDDRPTFVAAPIPQSSPALGDGLAVATLALYQPEGSGGVWTTGVAGLYTNTESWAVGLFQKAHFAEDRFRLTAAAGYGDMNLDFYGIGTNAGRRDLSVSLNQRGVFALTEALYRVRPNLYVGARYRLLNVDTSINREQIAAFPALELPRRGLESQVSGLGPAVEYDTRDTEYGPTKGLLVQSQWLWNDDAIGSDFDYGRLSVTMNGYHAAGRGVIAWRGALCTVSDGAPFYDLCMFGQSNDLRGYDPGRYRDNATWAAQAEYRRPLFWRFGIVAFAGVGGVASGMDDLGASTVLPAAGVGLRFAASQKYRVNMSIDAAWGKDSSAVYLYLGEAF